MFIIFRILKLFFALAVALLSIWALIGSYKNASYLTDIYLLDVQVTSLNLSAIFDVSEFTKRDTFNLNDFDKSSEVAKRSDIQQTIQLIIDNLDYSELGLSDVYTISYWGYCKGDVTNEETYDESLQKYIKPFDNKKLNITWCSDPVVGYKADPLEILKSEINNTINSYSTSTYAYQDSTIATELQTLVDNLSYDNLDLPGDLSDKLDLVHILTIVSFAFLLLTAILAVLSVAFQILSCIISFENCLISFLSFVYYVLIAVTSIVGAAVFTGAYLEIRKQINDNVSQFGIKSFLSISFTAFVWSAFVASLLMLITSIIGHCLSGLFHRRSKPLAQLDDELKFETLSYEPLMAYEGKEEGHHHY